MFDYLCEKIRDAPVSRVPFPHIVIERFLSPMDLGKILGDQQIHFPPQNGENDLYRVLQKKNWKIQPFPDCVSNWEDYITDSLFDESGFTFKLNTVRNKFIKDLMVFLNGPVFKKCLEDKFNIIKKTVITSSIQKNLSGYEISPNTDTRSKALTYVLNINKYDGFEDTTQHTHLLELKDERKYLEDLWTKNPELERFCVPWDWCDKVTQITHNNTMLLFQPQSQPASLYGVKLNYNHLFQQRTQIYGNLMYKTPPKKIHRSNWRAHSMGKL